LGWREIVDESPRVPYIPHIVRANNSQLARRGAALAGYVWGGCVASMMRSEFSSHSRKSFRRDR